MTPTTAPVTKSEPALTYTNTNPASGDDRQTPWLVNAYGGSSLPTTTPTTAAKNHVGADWWAKGTT